MSRSRLLVRQAIEVVIRRIAGLPSSPASDELLARAQDHLRQTDAWTAKSPPTEERQKLMNSVLALHVEVAKLEKAS